MELLQKGKIGGLGEDTLFIERGEDTVGLLAYEIDDLGIVDTKVDPCPLDLLALVLLLFEGEHVVVEEGLQTLVGVIDAKLLERIEFEDLEPGNIEDADETSRVGLGQELVHASYNPQEETVVDILGGGLTGMFSLLTGKMKGDKLTTCFDRGMKQGCLEELRVHSELGGSSSNLGRRIALSTFASAWSEADVTEMHDTGDDGEDLGLLLGGDTAHVHGN